MTVTQLSKLIVLLLNYSTSVATNQALALDAVILAEQVAATLSARLEAREKDPEESDIPF